MSSWVALNSFYKSAKRGEVEEEEEEEEEEGTHTRYYVAR